MATIDVPVRLRYSPSAIVEPAAVEPWGHRYPVEGESFDVLHHRGKRGDLRHAEDARQRRRIIAVEFEDRSAHVRIVPVVEGKILPTAAVCDNRYALCWCADVNS